MQRPGRQDGPGGASVPGLQLDVRVRENKKRLATHRGRCDVLPHFGYGANDSEACYIDSHDCTLQRPLLAAVFCNDFAGPVKTLVFHWRGSGAAEQVQGAALFRLQKLQNYDIWR